MTGTVKTWTVERRGGKFVVMSWTKDISAGPTEVVVCNDLESARSRINTSAGCALRWRDGSGEELKHGVVLAADRAE